VEAEELAALVTAWRERGYGPRDLAAALLDGPRARAQAAALLRDRLVRKLPPGRISPGWTADVPGQTGKAGSGRWKSTRS